MARPTAEHVAKAKADALIKSGVVAENFIKGNPDALTDSGNASRVAFRALAKAYQELATKNGKNLTAAIQALAAVRNPTEFIELQQKLIREGVDAAVRDSQNIAQLTAAAFTAAFAPVKKQIDALQDPAQR